MRDPTPQRVSAFVLAGGRSSRFGRDKARAPWRGRPLLSWVVERVGQQFDPVAVVGRRAEELAGLDVPAWEDFQPGLGPLGGLYTGLQRSTTNWSLCVACDMPCLRPDLLALLRERIAQGYDAVVPRVEGWWVPTLALYRRTLLPRLEDALFAGRLSLQSLLEGARVRTLDEPELKRADPTLLSFLNVNTPRELAGLKEPR